MIVALLLSAWQPVIAQESPPTPEPLGLRPDAPDYAKHGSYWVGYKPIVIGEGTDHSLEAGLWYPALNPEGTEEAVTYSITLKGSANLTSRWRSQGARFWMRRWMPPRLLPPGGLLPWFQQQRCVVQHYHRAPGVPWLHRFDTEHVEHFDPEWSEIWSASIDRPRDMEQRLDYAEQMAAPAGGLAGLIDMENVAVAGHSYGGYTTLAMAGAQYDPEAFNARCAELPAEDPNLFLCAPVVPRKRTWPPTPGWNPCRKGCGRLSEIPA